ncbi:MAG: hypothetical protein IPN94_21060 [Sphingobacteriales bacterium]|nr:hypothetical protein [Sphingobacteriales bacterium]
MVCAGQSSTLDAGAGYANYAWNTGASAQTLVANTAATYTVTVTDNNGCTGIDDFVLTVNANPTPQITGDDAVCAGQSSTLDAGAGYANYAWNNGTSAQTLVANAAGTYTVTVTDGNGCVGTDTFVLSINANPTPNITGALEFCTGFSTVLNARNLHRLSVVGGRTNSR